MTSWERDEVDRMLAWSGGRRLRSRAELVDRALAGDRVAHCCRYVRDARDEYEAVARMLEETGHLVGARLSPGRLVIELDTGGRIEFLSSDWLRSLRGVRWGGVRS